jgi:hypothetical protein
VTQADSSTRWPTAQSIGQHGDLAGTLLNEQIAALGDQGDAG